jgi:hypothetical protein
VDEIEQLREEAWIGDAVLALFVRDWLLTVTGRETSLAERTALFELFASNRFYRISANRPGSKLKSADFTNRTVFLQPLPSSRRSFSSDFCIRRARKVTGCSRTRSAASLSCHRQIKIKFRLLLRLTVNADSSVVRLNHLPSD